jgi:tetratricopeptide (TPR) repeat protein
MEAIRRAATLDPLSPNIQTILGLKYWFTGREDEALAQFDKALELDPSFPLTLMHKSWLCWTTGDVESFFETYERLEKVSARAEVPAADLRHAYATGGREAVLRLLLDSPSAKLRPVDRARWHTSLGDLDAAFLDLDQAMEERAVWLPFVVNRPDLKPLHDDPRWRSMLVRMNLLP